MARPPCIAGDAAVYAPDGVANTSRPSVIRNPRSISSHPAT